MHNVWELIWYNYTNFSSNDFVGGKENQSNIFAAAQAWLLTVCNKIMSYLLFRHTSSAWPQLSSTDTKQNVSFTLEIKIFRTENVPRMRKGGLFSQTFRFPVYPRNVNPTSFIRGLQNFFSTLTPKKLTMEAFPRGKRLLKSGKAEFHMTVVMKKLLGFNKSRGFLVIQKHKIKVNLSLMPSKIKY